MERKANFQPLAWFWDLFNRDRLDLDPPYQRRSIWNQEYKNFFVDTVLQGYPCPAIFLYEEITPEGLASYSVVDGKQRLSTLFEFVSNEFPTGTNITTGAYREKYFKDLDNETKTNIWKYQFALEYIPSSSEELINNIFDRINRNVAKLSPQELRHARFDGEFISVSETLAEWMFQILPKNFPYIAASSRRQMKDVEFVAQLLLLTEEGPRSYSQNDLDGAFSNRDSEWESKEDVVERFRGSIDDISKIIESDSTGAIPRTRLRNQADFYSFFGAIRELKEIEQGIDFASASEHILRFVEIVDDAEKRKDYEPADTYYTAARSASNDAGPRRTRIDIMKSLLSGAYTLPPRETDDNI